MAAPDRVSRDFAASAPDQLWVADITYVPTGEGWLYLATVLDAWSRRIVGWAMADTLRTALVVDALNMAVWNRRPATGVVHHSDRGAQYTSLAFSQRCQDAGVAPSMGSVGDAYDNALAEAFFASLKTELLLQHTFATRKAARLALFDNASCPLPRQLLVLPLPREPLLILDVRCADSFVMAGKIRPDSPSGRSRTAAPQRGGSALMRLPSPMKSADPVGVPCASKKSAVPIL